MAATVMTSPQRQPFASLGGSRLRSLGNIKNCQNGVTAQLSPPTKRRAPEPSFDDVDQENFNPELVSALANKKAKNFDFNALQSTKPSKFTLVKANSSPAISTRPTLTPKRLQSTNKPSAPGARSTPLTIKTTQPSSAPAALAEPGRKSPSKSKRVGITRRRVSSSPSTRVDPPSYAPTQGLPFSIDAALSSTVFAATSLYDAPPPPALTPLSTAGGESSIPTSWQFEIYEDKPEEYAGTLIEHSTWTLDISDDEGRFSPALSDCDKENVPPADAELSYAVSRRDMMTDEPRTPLGDLAASEYYADGCDANSFVIVPGDQDAPLCGGAVAALTSDLSASTPATSASEGSSAQEGWKAILEKLNADKRVKAEVEKFAAGAGAAEIEIWESESAKAEDEGMEKGIKSFAWVSPLGSPKAGSEAGDENASPSPSSPY